MQDNAVDYDAEDENDIYDKYGQYDDFEDDPVFEKTNKQTGLAKFR